MDILTQAKQIFRAIERLARKNDKPLVDRLDMIATAAADAAREIENFQIRMHHGENDNAEKPNGRGRPDPDDCA
jgi:hypothetical protein